MYAQRDHLYGMPINQISYLKNEDYIASSDNKTIRVWSENDQNIIVSFEPGKAKVNGFCLAEPGTGLFFVPTESPRIHTYFIPSIGPAPKFCSFLDNIVEQLEENERTQGYESLPVYDNFKFLTRTQMDEMAISSYIGTPLCRAYMHGFLIEMSAYQNALAKKLHSEAETVEISKEQEESTSDLPQVNPDLFVNLQKKHPNILNDERFSQLFNDIDFEAKKDEKLIHRSYDDQSIDSIESDQSMNDHTEEKTSFQMIPFEASNVMRETLASKLKRSALASQRSNINSEQSMTFIPKSVLDEEESRRSKGETRTERIKRKKACKIRTANEINRKAQRNLLR